MITFDKKNTFSIFFFFWFITVFIIDQNWNWTECKTFRSLRYFELIPKNSASSTSSFFRNNAPSCLYWYLIMFSRLYLPFIYSCFLHVSYFVLACQVPYIDLTVSSLLPKFLILTSFTSGLLLVFLVLNLFNKFLLLTFSNVEYGFIFLNGG